MTGNISEVLVVACALALLPDLALPLLPVQLLWINLITDGLPPWHSASTGRRRTRSSCRLRTSVTGSSAQDACARS